jgi:hypothetical protein
MIHSERFSINALAIFAKNQPKNSQILIFLPNDDDI